MRSAMHPCLETASKTSCSLYNVIFFLDNYLDFVEICSLAFTCKSIFNLILKKNSCLCHCQFSHSYQASSRENVIGVERHWIEKDSKNVSLISSCFYHPTRIVHLKLGGWWHYLDQVDRFFFARAAAKSHVLTLLIDTSFYTYQKSFCYKNKELRKMKKKEKSKTNSKGNSWMTLPTIQSEDDYNTQDKIIYNDSRKMMNSKENKVSSFKTSTDQHSDQVIFLRKIIHRILSFEFLENGEELKINGVALTLKDDILQRFDHEIYEISKMTRTTRKHEFVSKNPGNENGQHAKTILPPQCPEMLSLLKQYKNVFVSLDDQKECLSLESESLNYPSTQKHLILQRIAIALRILCLCSESVEEVLFMPLPDSFTTDLCPNELPFMQLFYMNTFCKNVHFLKLKSISFPSSLNGQYVLPLLNSSFFPSLHQVSLLGLNVQCGSSLKKITSHLHKQSSQSYKKLSGEYHWGIYPTQDNSNAIYYGSVDHFSRFHGIGIYVCKTYMYEGCFREGFNDGYGILNTTYGEQYQGFWRKGYRHGYGIGKKNNGTLYEGNWKHDVLHGRGFMKDSHNLSYDGEWFNGLFHGWGVILLRNQIIAIGEFYAGKPFGKFRCRQNLLYVFLKSQDLQNTKTIAYQDIHSPRDYLKISKTIGLSKDSSLEETTYRSQYMPHSTLLKAFSLNDISTLCRKPYNFLTKTFCLRNPSTPNHSVEASKLVSDNSFMYTTKASNLHRLNVYQQSLSLKRKFKVTPYVKKHEKETNDFQLFHSTNWTCIYINSQDNNNIFPYATTCKESQNILLLDADCCHQNYFSLNSLHKTTPIPHWIQHLLNFFSIP